MTGEMSAIILPNKTAIPNKIKTNPKYIGFLLKLKGPEVTRFFGFSPGGRGISNF